MTVEILYPEAMNLYGEQANARYLAKATGAELALTHLYARPRFTYGDVALVYMGSGSWSGQLLARDALTPWIGDLIKRTEQGGTTLFTGSAFEVLGKYIQDEEGGCQPMLGLLPFYTDRSFLNRYNAIYLGKLGGETIVGHKSQFGWSHLIPDAPCPLPGPLTFLFRTLRGSGLDRDTAWEGLRSKNLMATAVSGPVVIQNPPLARYLLALMGSGAPLLCADAAAASYRARVREFSDPGRGVVY